MNPTSYAQPPTAATPTGRWTALSRIVLANHRNHDRRPVVEATIPMDDKCGDLDANPTSTAVGRRVDGERRRRHFFQFPTAATKITVTISAPSDAAARHPHVFLACASNGAVSTMRWWSDLVLVFELR
jgi:hypothetical protein